MKEKRSTKSQIHKRNKKELKKLDLKLNKSILNWKSSKFFAITVTVKFINLYLEENLDK